MNDGSLKDLSFSNLLPTAHISPKSKLKNDDGRWHFHHSSFMTMSIDATDSPVVSEAIHDVSVPSSTSSTRGQKGLDDASSQCVIERGESVAGHLCR